MEQKSYSSFDEWKNDNPNGSLNNYYAIFRTNHTMPYTKVEAEIPIVKYEEPNHISLIVGCVAGVLGLIGYFTPWFSIPMLNISVSGNEVKQLVTLFSGYTNMVQDSSIKGSLPITQNMRLNTVLYAINSIPFVYILLLLGSIIKSNIITIMASLLSLAITGYIVYFFINIPQIISFTSVGIYLIGLSCVITIYNLFTLKF